MSRKLISRRSVLRGSGVALTLPALAAMEPAASRAADANGTSGLPPRRMLAICNNLGLLPNEFFPKQAGAEYKLSPYLQELERHRNDFTVLSGVSHPDVDGGHPADICFLTAAPHPGRGGFRNSISLDQLIAEHNGQQTRFPSLTLGVNVLQGQRSLSFTAQGVLIPCQQSAAVLFGQLFLDGGKRAQKEQFHRLRQGRSILDTIGEQAKDLGRELSPSDQSRLDQFYTGVRDLEQQMTQAQEWGTRPKPKVTSAVPLDPTDPSAFMEKTELMYEMARLALETDSTRSITLLLDGVNTPALQVDGETTTSGYHNLSHHGKRDEKIAELKRIDRWHMKLFSKLLTSLKATPEEEHSLLDRTMVLYGSNLGDANMHSTVNLPVLLAGGGFQHGRHLAFDPQRNYPLPNLYVSMLQRLGMEVDQFVSSTGTLRGLEMVGYN